MDRESDEVHSDEEAATSSSREVMISRQSDSQVAGRLNTSSLSDGSISVSKNRIEGSTLNIGCQEVHQHFHTTTYLPREIESSEPVSNFKKTDKELQQNLRKAAHIASTTSERPLLAGTKKIYIEKVPIEIAVETDYIREGAHSEHSKDFLEAKASPESGLAVEDLLPLCLEQAKNEAKLCCNSDEAKEQYLQQHGNIVSIIGEAGIGKTAFSKTLTQKLLNESLVDFDYIFYIPIRKINFDVKTNLLRFLMKSASCNLKYKKLSERDVEEIFDNLDENPGVVIILDGLDEAQLSDMNPCSLECDSFEEANAEGFIKNLLKGVLLPKAKKFVTSRPNQLYDLPEDYKPHFIARILGLSKASQENLCKQICGEKSSVVLQYLQDHPDLKAQCYAPVNCILTMHCINEGLSNPEKKITFNTVTGILAHVFKRCHKLHFKKNVERGEEELKKLCDLAWLGHSKKIFMFDKRHLTKVKIDYNILKAFLDTRLSENLTATILEGGEKQHYFPHLIWQAFFSAIHLVLFMPTEEFNLNEEPNIFSESTPEKVVEFMFGLYNNVVFEEISTIFAFTGTLNLTKKDSLRLFALNLVPGIIPSREDTIRLVRLCTLLYESQDNELRKEVAAALPSTIELKGSLNASDVNCLYYVLSGRSIPIQVDVHVNFVGNSFISFFRKMSAASKIQIANISLTKILIDEESAKSLVCLRQVDNLGFIDCQFTDRAVKIISEGLNDFQKKIGAFGLDSCQIGQEGGSVILGTLCNVENLVLFQCGITCVPALPLMHNPMKMLNLSGNSIGDNGARIISSNLSKTEGLYLLNCDITEIGVQALRDGLKKLNKPIEILKFSYTSSDSDKSNKFDVSWSQSAASGYHDCSMTGTNAISAVGVEVICELIRLVNFQMHVLQFNHCKIGDAGAQALFTSLAKVEKLELTHCGITYIGMTHIAVALKRFSKPVKLLEFNETSIGDDGARLISSNLSQVEGLHMLGCDITEDGVKALRDGIKKLEKAMKALKFSYVATALAEKLNKFMISWDMRKSPSVIKFEGNITGAGVEMLCSLICLLNMQIQLPVIHLVKDAYRAVDALVACARKIESINIFCKDTSPDSVKLLANSLKSFRDPINELQIDSHQMADEVAKALSTCLAKVKSLSIANCGVTENGMKYFYESLTKLSEPMKALDISGNKVADKGIISLCWSLSKIERLSFRNCEITNVGIQAFATAIKRSQITVLNSLTFSYSDESQEEQYIHIRSGETIYFYADVAGTVVEIISSLIRSSTNVVEEFHLSNCKDADVGAQAISTCLGQIQELFFITSDLTKTGVEWIAKSINNLHSSISSLVLSGNKGIDDSAVEILSSCLTKVDALDLSDCSITEKGAKCLSDGLQNRQNSISSLVLHGNKGIDDSAVEVLSSCITKVDALDLSDCSITEKGVKYISDGLQNRQNRINRLALYGNSIGDEGAEFLSHCMDKIDTLDINKCDITSAGVDALASSIDKLSRPIKDINLDDNIIGLDGAKALAKCLRNIQTLSIRRCRITEAGFRILTVANEESPKETFLRR